MKQGMLRYGLALGAVTASTTLMICLRPYLDRGSVALPLAAVMASAFYGGLGPGLLATILSVLASDFLFMVPRYSLSIHSADDLAEIAIFSAVAILINVLNNASRKAKQALEESNADLERRVRERTAWLTLVYDITGAASETTTVEQAYRYALQRLGEQMPWKFALLHLPVAEDSATLAPAYFQFDENREPLLRIREHYAPLTAKAGEGPVGRVFQGGAAEIVRDLPQVALDAGFKAGLVFAVLVDRQPVAVFECLSDRPLERDQNLMDLVNSVGVELGLIVDRKRLEEDYAEGVWRQQKETAQEFHDDIGQRLTGLGFLGSSLAEKLRDTPHGMVAGRLSKGIEEALQRMRELVRGVLPVALDASGLRVALSEMTRTITEDSKVPCQFECSGDVRIEDNRVALHLYRIAQESVTNALKHGHPTRVQVRLEDTPTDIRLEVSDDGTGMPEPSGRKEGSGLRIMRYRAATIAARLYITTVSGRGTRVECQVPKNGKPEKAA